MAYTGNKPTNVVDVSETQALTVDGDLTVDTDTLKADSANNRVGVGTASPVAPLHVKAATDVHVGIDDSSSDALIFAANDASATAVVPLKFQANSFKFNGSSEFVRIADDGKVGIGTVSPDTLLNLKDTGLSFSINDKPKSESTIVFFLFLSEV